MNSAIDINAMASTLGLFMQGIPCVFLRSDVYALQPIELSKYATFFRESRSDPELNASFSEHTLGFQYMITPSHELKHFHDAAMFGPLFEIFLLRAKRSLVLLQLGRRIENLANRDLPITLSYLRSLVSPGARTLVDYLATIEKSYDYRSKHLVNVRTIWGVELTIPHLLEASAMILELGTLVHLHGWDAAKFYYESVVVALPDVYSAILKLIVSIGLDWERSLALAHTIVTASLYDDSNPLVALDEILGTSIDAGAILARAEAKIIRLFSAEEKLQARLNTYRLMSDGEVLDTSKMDDPMLHDLATLPQQMMSVRSSLVAKYAREWKFGLDHYSERLNEVLLPPTVVFPVVDDRKVSAMPISTIKLLAKEYYVIAGTKSVTGEYESVISAIVPTLNLPMCVKPESADTAMMCAYFWRRLFQPVADFVFNKVQDEMYEAIFQKYYLKN